MTDSAAHTTQLHNWLERMRAGDLAARDELLRRLGAPLERLARKMLRRYPRLQKDVAKRYVTAEALAEDLCRFRLGEPIVARPVGAAEWVTKWVRRNPLVSGLLAAVAVVLLLGTGVSTTLALVALSQAEQAGKSAAASRKNESLAKEEKNRAQKEETRANMELARARAHFFNSQLSRVAPIYERDPLGALELLHDYRACPIELRDSSWRFYERACSSWLVDSLQGHLAGVMSISFSPGGKTLATASKDMRVKLWDVATGQERATLKGDKDFFRHVRFSPDGKLLASLTKDGTVKLWDVATGEGRATIKGGTGLLFVVYFSPDGRTLAYGGENLTLKLWDIAAGQERATFKLQMNEGPALSFSPNGKTLTFGSSDGENGTVKVCDIATGKERVLKGHTGGVISVSFSPDNQTLASAGADRTVRL